MAVPFIALVMIPVNFDYWIFAILVFFNGLGGGIFTAPNTAAIMSSVPAAERGAASGVRATFFNAGSSLSIGIFFSLMIIGLANTLPAAMSTGLQEQGVSASVAHEVANLPPVGSLFAAFLGYNPMGELLAAVSRVAAARCECGRADRADVLPALDHRAVPCGAGRRVRRRRGNDGDRHDRIVVQRGPLRRRTGRRQRGVGSQNGGSSASSVVKLRV